MFMCLVAIYMSCSVKGLFMSLGLFVIDCLFLLLGFDSSLHILDTSPLATIWFKHILSDELACVSPFN